MTNPTPTPAPAPAPTQQAAANPATVLTPQANNSSKLTGWQAFGFGSVILLALGWIVVPAEPDSLSITEALNPRAENLLVFFSAFLIIVALIEQACMVIINIAFGRKTHAADHPTEGLMEATKRTRFIVSQIFCLALALSVAWVGFRILEWITPAMGIALPTDNENKLLFQRTDLFLSTLLLAGGADRFHQVIKNAFRDSVPEGQVVQAGT
ncbi:MAG: hypothetical protein AAFP80_07965 [Pseudomonadota bacterium]